MNIPNEAVEAAARASYEWTYGPAGWDTLPAKPKQPYLDYAARILEAAAPYMQGGYERKTTAFQLNDPDAKWEEL